MKTQLITVLICSGILMISCNTKPEAVVVSEKEDVTGHLYLKSYHTPKFENDQRIEKIKGVTQKLKDMFDEHAKEKNIPGISYGIVVGDSLVIASSTGVINIEKNLPAHPKSCFRIASMTKSFTAMAILKLRDEGKLLLSNPVTKYIPEISKLQYLTKDSPVITIENLLTMTAGFPEDNPWGDRQLAMSNEDFITLVSEGLSLSKIPSYQYEYSNTGYAMLGYIISQVAGISYQEYIKEHIFIPLGMHNTYWEYANVPEQQLAIGYRWEDEQWKLEPMLHDGVFGAMGGLITTIEDFSRYVSFHLSAWPARSTEDMGLVKRSTLREMHVPKFPFLNTRNKDWNGTSCPQMIGYGYGLGIANDCKRITRISHGGALPGFASNYAFFPKYGIGLMAFGNLTYTRPIPYDKIEKMFFETLEIQPRRLPVSDILAKQKEQIVQLLKRWNATMPDEIFADNFFLDTSKEKKINEIQDILNKAGNIQEIDELYPRNQLRGDFKMKTEHGELKIFFTLSPEKDPKIQRMYMSFTSKEDI